MTAVLVADDNWPDLKSLLSVWLGKRELVFEDRGDMVLPLLNKRSDIGVVLLDLRFEGQRLQGQELVHHIHRSHPLVQVIILSSRADVDLALTLKQEGKILYYFEKEKLQREKFVSHVVGAIETFEHSQKSEGLCLAFIDAKSNALIGSTPLSLTNMQYALYRTAAQAALEQWPGVGATGFGGSGWLAFRDFFDSTTQAAQLFLTIYEGSYRHAILRPDRLREYMEEASDPKRLKGYREGRCDQIRKIISPCRSHINKELERALSDRKIVDRFKIHQQSRRRDGKPISTFGLKLEPERIKIDP